MAGTGKTSTSSKWSSLFSLQKSEKPDGKISPSNYSVDWLIVHCLGFGACWGWVHVVFFSIVVLGGEAEQLSLDAWFVNVAANGIGIVLLGVLSLKMGQLSSSVVLKVIFALLTALGTVGLFFAHTDNEVFVMAGAVASGVGSAGILLLWAEAYRSIAPLVAKKYTIPWSMAIGVLFYLLICMLPNPFGVITTIALPILSVVSVSQTYHVKQLRSGLNDEEIFPLETGNTPLTADSEPVAESVQPDMPLKALFPKPLQGRSIIRVLPLRFTAYIGIYCIAAGYMRGFKVAVPFVAENGIGEAVFAGAAVVLILVAIMSILFFGKRKIDIAYKLIVPFMAAGLLLLPFCAPSEVTIAAMAIMSGYILFEAYVWACLADYAANVAVPSALVFGVGKFGMNAGLFIGTFIGMFLGSNSSMLMVAMSLMIVYLFIVVENMVTPKNGIMLPLESPEKAIAATQGITIIAPDEPTKINIAEAAQMGLVGVFGAMLQEHCAIIATKYGLSARESEVLDLLAKGNSLQAIADELGVAYSTIKTHTDRIYSKTDVHSRKELMQLIEEAS